MRSVPVFPTICFLLFALACDKSPREPRIHVEQETIDAGKMAYGETKKVEIGISNRGRANLMLGNIKTSCSCTSTTLSAKVVRPGEFSQLSFVFHASQPQGYLSQSLAIESNDPERPLLPIKIVVTGDTPIVVSPSYLDLGEIRKGDSVTRTVLLTLQLGADFTTKTISLPEEVGMAFRPYDNDFIRRLDRRLTTGTQVVNLDVRLDATRLSLGDYEKSIWISEAHHAGVHIRASIVGDIQASPASFYYGVTSVAGDPVRAVSLSSRMGVPFRILSVDAGNLPVTVKFDSSSAETTTHEIVASLRSDSLKDGKRRLLNGIVKLRTSLAAQPEVEVPLFALWETSR